MSRLYITYEAFDINTFILEITKENKFSPN